MDTNMGNFGGLSLAVQCMFGQPVGKNNAAEMKSCRKATSGKQDKTPAVLIPVFGGKTPEPNTIRTDV